MNTISKVDTNSDLIILNGWLGPYRMNKPNKPNKQIITHWRNDYIFENSEESKELRDYEKQTNVRTITLDPTINHIVISATDKYDTSLLHDNKCIIPDNITKLSIQGSNVKIIKLPANIKHIKFYNSETLLNNYDTIYLWPRNGVKYEYVYRKKPLFHHNIIKTEKYTIDLDFFRVLYDILPFPIAEEILYNVGFLIRKN